MHVIFNRRSIKLGPCLVCPVVILIFVVAFRAIMRYHGLKMTEINKIIKEYWINTYKGNGAIDVYLAKAWALACEYSHLSSLRPLGVFGRPKTTSGRGDERWLHGPVLCYRC